MKQKLKKPAIIVLALCCLLVICGIGMGKSNPVSSELENTQTAAASETETGLPMPWEAEGAKLPEEYTLEEYEGLSPEQQKAFQEYLGTAAFDEWLKNSEIASSNLPWKKAGAKQPADYTWIEYHALTETEQKAFMANLGPYGLEKWLEKVLPQKSDTSNSSSDTAADKQPMDYTLEEYQALSAAEKKAFVDWLGISGFQAWLKSVQGQKVNPSQKETYPWEESGAKKPEDYTLEEYEALTMAQQRAFQKYMGTSGFDAWLKKARGEKYPWEESGAKQPKDYSWEDYDALTGEQKKAFQEYLGAREFEKWRESFFQPEEYPWEKADAKQPADYTWKEYKALTEAQQYAFQNHLGSAGMETWLRTITEIPWEKAGAKQPENYTLEAYKKLTEQQQLAFRIHLGSMGFDAWYEEAQRVKEENPWEKPGAKQPKDYTLAEFNALTAAQQMAFQNHLGAKVFEEWLQSQQEANPWEAAGAKQPKDYTLAEYNALTASQQMAFQDHLGAEVFAAWLNKAQSQPEVNPWEKPGAKQPADYTMKEYEALTASQQMAFQRHLGAEAFAAWLNKNQPQPEGNPWEKPGAKQPADYTRSDFDALTAAQQIAFQNYLGPEGFAAWLDKDEPQPEANPWEKPGAKQPADYTMSEFEALTAAQQIAFQNYLGPEAFAAWLNKDQLQPETNPWDVSGAKQPEDYTMAEFEALTAAQQIAFQSYLGPAGFEAWLTRETNA